MDIMRCNHTMYINEIGEKLVDDKSKKQLEKVWR